MQGRVDSNCSDCALAGICLPVALELSDVERLEDIVQQGRILRRGQTLFEAQKAFESIYAIKSGCIKTGFLDSNGVEQITGFVFPGELIGMDGIHQGKHFLSATALDTSAICEIPFHRLEGLSAQIPSLQKHLLSLMSAEIQNDKRLHMVLSKKPADDRVASFLANVSLRFERRKLSPTRFRLAMSRGEIGNYLGLTVETVSRTLSRLQAQGIIRVIGKEIEILENAILREIAGV